MSLDEKVGTLIAGQTQIQVDLEVIKKDLSEEIKCINTVLNGNGKVGIVAQVKFNSSWISKQREKRDSILNFVYRTVIAIILVFIATKVGLK